MTTKSPQRAALAVTVAAAFALGIGSTGAAACTTPNTTAPEVVSRAAPAGDVSQATPADGVSQASRADNVSQASRADNVSQASRADENARILELTNEERAKVGIQPLSFDPCLEASAQQWSERMSAEERLYHSDLSAVMSSCGLDRAAENVAMGGESAERTVQMWMDSPGHRANILDPNLTKLGVGWAPDGSYATQQFG